MQLDFHYYATYCAAYLAGYDHEESLAIAYADQFTDCCSRPLLKKLGAPKAAATTQLQTELINQDRGLIDLQNITRIWAPFHFLPQDLYAKHPKRPKRYMNKYRLICGPNGALLADTVMLAKGKSLQAVGTAMHILADTWAHRYFAGTPSAVINNTNPYFYEILRADKTETERKISFRHNPAAADDPEKGIYTASVRQENEISIMNLGHGRAGHLPDYSFARYKYMPAWGDYEVIVKDNPSDYYRAFTQMVYAMKYLRGEYGEFETDVYDTTSVAPWEDTIRGILEKRRCDSCADWKAFGEKLSGQTIEDFDMDKYQMEYLTAVGDAKDETFLGRYFIAAMAQKSMVTHKIFESGNILAGLSVDYRRKGFKGIRDFRKLIERYGGERRGE